MPKKDKRAKKKAQAPKVVKRRKGSQPLQSQKQVVNINFREEKKKQRKKRRKEGKQTDQLRTSVQILGSNLNMLGSETARLNNLENLIQELRREKAPITSGRPSPQMISQATQITSGQVGGQTQTKRRNGSQPLQEEEKVEIDVPPTPPSTPAPLRKSEPLTEDFLLPLRDDYMRDIETGNFQLTEMGDQADLLTSNITPPYEKKETLEQVKENAKKKLKLRVVESLKRDRKNVSDEPFESGVFENPTNEKMEQIQGLAGIVALSTIDDVLNNLYTPAEERPEPLLTPDKPKKPRKPRAIELQPRKIYNTKNRRADALYRETLLGKTFQAIKNQGDIL